MNQAITGMLQGRDRTHSRSAGRPTWMVGSWGDPRSPRWLWRAQAWRVADDRIYVGRSRITRDRWQWKTPSHTTASERRRTLEELSR
jgi:hypothetical protein